MTFSEYLQKGNVAFFGYRGSALPEVLKDKKSGRVRVFTTTTPTITSVPAARYTSLSQIRDEHADIYFLDHEALRVLLVDFPATAHYVALRLALRTSAVLALIGLLRRLYIGLVRIEGVETLAVGEKKERWLIVRHTARNTLHTRLSLSAEVGIPGFLEHLRAEGFRYVILRFFEKLPSLYRKGGDLDVLVADEDERRLKDYLQEHPGSIGVDVWTPSRVSHNSITYYPPPLARKILSSAEVGPAGALVPAPQEAFLGLAYHALYHKGLFAGVPTRIVGLTTNPHPENDYTEALRRMAEQLGISVEITMESLDEYLASVGWRPKIDTLAKIAPHNVWVWHRFFSRAPMKEIGLGVFILKRRALAEGLEERMLRTIEEGGFRIVRVKKFSEAESARVAEHLRGGVWGSSDGSGDLLPAMAVMVIDVALARAAQLGLSHSGEEGIKALKARLRKTFDTGKGSLTHSTDTTEEAHEYLHWCFYGEEDEVKKEVEAALQAIKPSALRRFGVALNAFPRFLRYRWMRARRRLTSRILRYLMSL